MSVERLIMCIGLHIIFLLCTFTNVACQATTVVEAIEGETNVPLTFTIPSESVDIFLITIKRGGTTDVAYVYMQNFNKTITGPFKERLSSQPDQDNRVTFTLNSIVAKDAGSYECLPETLTTALKGCGLKLIIIRKPDPPIVELAADSGHVVGQDLNLICQTRSTSLPSDHGLQSLVEWWVDPAFEQDSERITQNAENLTLTFIDREDKGKVFRCRSSDSASDVNKRQWSDHSDDFVISPEYGPSSDDIVITPSIQYGSTKSVILASPVQFSCSVTCEPQCNVFWEFKGHASDSFQPAPSAYSTGGSMNIQSVRRASHGEYRCVGENKHGRVEHQFYLNVYYMLTPIPYIDGVQTDVGHTFEGNGDVVLKCDCDSNPRPFVSWNAPDNRLLPSSELQGPEDITSDNGLLVHRYSSEAVLQDLKCSDSGLYQCRSNTAEIGSMYKNVTVEVKCKPRPVPEGQYRLQQDYVWKIPHDLYVNFLVEAWPKPSLTRVESEKDGVRISERSDVDVMLRENFDRKPFWTLVKFQSKRELTLEDDGRTFIITLANSDFETPFRFTIHTSGPPQPVTDITTDRITHNAVHLSWLPGFNGGEPQTFAVLYYRSGGSGSDDDSQNWAPLVTDIPDSSASKEERVTAVAEGLASSTAYRLRVMATNKNGNSTVEHRVTTLASPAASSSLAGGAIAGIVIGVLLFIIIVVAVLLYVFVFRKRWRATGGSGATRLKPAAKVRAVYRHFRGQNGAGTPTSSSDRGGAKVRPKERRPIFLGKPDGPPSKVKDYQNVPTESVDPTLLEDDYANANDIRAPMLNEPVYSNAEGNPEGGGDGRVLNEDGLHYASLDFSDVKTGKGGKKAAGKRSKKPKRGGGEEEEVVYKDIDFAKTKAKQLEMEKEEEERAALTAAAAAAQQELEDETPYAVVDKARGTAV